MLTPTLKGRVLHPTKAQNSSKWAAMLSWVTIRNRGTNQSLVPRRVIKMNLGGTLISNTAEIDNFKLIKNKFNILKIWMITLTTWASSIKNKNSICSKLIHRAKTLKEEATKSLSSLNRTTNTNRGRLKRSFKVTHRWEDWAMVNMARETYWSKIKTTLP